MKSFTWYKSTNVNGEKEVMMEYKEKFTYQIVFLRHEERK